MRIAILAALMGSSLLFGQAITGSTENTQRTYTNEKLDGNRTRIVQHSDSTRNTSDNIGHAKANSAHATTVTRYKHGKKIQSTTSSEHSSSVNP